MVGSRLTLACLACIICHMTNGEDSVKSALLIVDIQNCFTVGGTLAVKDGELIIPVINEIRRNYGSHFEKVILSQDWHCSDHVSFASSHSGKNIYDVIELDYQKSDGALCGNSTHASTCSGGASSLISLNQTLWPDHCVINTTDAEIRQDLIRDDDDILVQKGYQCQVDSYSVFFDNGKFQKTKLDSILKSAGIDRVYLVGLALDYCVYWSATDAKELGYETYVIEDACRPVAEDTGKDAVTDMKLNGVHVIQSKDVNGTFVGDSTSSSTTLQAALIGMLCCMLFSLLFARLQ